MSEQETDPSKQPVICIACKWHGVASDLIVRDDGSHCPRCDQTTVALHIGAPTHQDPDK